MNLFKRFKKKPAPKATAPKKECPLCSKVAAQGRSGEKKFKFVDDDTATVEIVNQTGMDGRLCYSLFVQNEPEIGFTEMPIRYCPLCGKNLRRK